MAKGPDDCECWLLPQFLIHDDDLFSEFSNSSKRNDGRNSTSSFGVGFKQDLGCGFGDFGLFGPQSDIGSPLEGSTGTESDDDDYISELTRKFAHSSLHESTFAFENKRVRGLSGSPESTLSGALGGGCGCNRCSSRGSPNCMSQVASPTGMNGNETAWDLLHAAAGQIARMRMMEEASGIHRKSHNGGLVGLPSKPSPISVPQQRNPNPNPTHLSYQQHLKAFHFQLLMQQQMRQKKFQLSQTQQMVLNGGRKPTVKQSGKQQETGSGGMRAVLLGNPGSNKRECAGTGVFLPRGIGAPAPPRKKPPCSTVLLPDRVVQALNLKLEAMDTQAQPKYSGAMVPDYAEAAAAPRYQNGGVMDQQRRSVRQQHPVVMSQAPELQLPPEWTY